MREVAAGKIQVELKVHPNSAPLELGVHSSKLQGAQFRFWNSLSHS